MTTVRLSRHGRWTTALRAERMILSALVALLGALAVAVLVVPGTFDVPGNAAAILRKAREITVTSSDTIKLAIEATARVNHARRSTSERGSVSVRVTRGLRRERQPMTPQKRLGTASAATDKNRQPQPD